MVYYFLSPRAQKCVRQRLPQPQSENKVEQPQHQIQNTKSDASKLIKVRVRSLWRSGKKKTQ